MPTAAAPPPAPEATAATAETVPPPRGRAIALVYTSNVQGHFTPCACAVQPLGGVARRATLVGRARAESDATVVVDAGDLFQPEGTAAETERQARLLAAAFGRTGLDAFTPGEGDLAIGLPLLKKMAATFDLPVVSANLYGRDGRRLFDADRLIDAGGLRVGLFGISAPPTAEAANRWRADGIEARDGVEAGREAVRSLRARGAQVVVALVHGGAPAENRRLVAALDGVDWAVLGHSALNLETPEKAGGARLLEAFSEGKNLGRLDLHWVNGELSFADRGERDEVAAILADHRRQLGGYDRSLGGMDPAALEDYYRQRRVQLELAIARERLLLARLPTTITGSWFQNRILPLDSTVPDDPGVGKLVRDYRVGEMLRRKHAGLVDGPRPHL